MKKTIQHTKLALAVSAITFTAGQAYAQEEFALEEIVVTAQKRAESMQEVPVAVSAIGSNDIEALGWDKPQDVAAQVPNMQMSAPLGDAQPLFAIRGVSMIDYTPSASSPVGVYADEAYIGSSYLHGLSMFDMERIEVLRGPQGTLYGKNTTGGAINLISRTPDLDGVTTGFVTGGVGNHGMNMSSGAIESPLIDGKLAARFAYTYKKDDGIWDNSNGPDMGQTDYRAARLTLNYQPTDDLNAVLKITHGKSTPRAAVNRAEGTNGGSNYAGTNGVDFGEGSINKVGKSETEMTGMNLKVSYEMEQFSLVSVTSYYDGDYLAETDVDGTSAPLAGIDWKSDTKAYAQDLRIVSDFDGDFNFIAGLYYGHEDINTHVLHDEFYFPGMTNIPAGSPVNALQFLGQVDRTMDVTKESMALYSHFTYDINENLGLTVGLRYTEDESTRDQIRYCRINGIDPGFGPLAGQPTEGCWLPGNTTGLDSPINPATFQWTHSNGLTNASGEELTETEREFTGTISLDYQLTEDVMTYVSYSRGFRAGQFNNGLVYTADTPAYADPEFVDAYELGFKGEFFDSRMRLNGSLFYYDYADQQFVNQVGVSANLENAGGVDIYGLELELLAMPTENLTIQAGLGLLDSEYNELDLYSGAAQASVDLKGNEPVSSPDVNFNIALDYEFAVTDGIYGKFHIDGNYLDDQWFSAFNDKEGFEEIKQDAYWLWNARTTFTDESERYALSLWVQNIADKEYDVYGINLQGGFGFNYFMEGRPRSYGVDLTYRF
ncbi:TonB-dependent receptor [Maricurvus nonylphenolicus]|uniref:TonB-dependent receptor n=1 Tax=Maricurvus nonylphenolicus TaxID=1008307 RepID=UPI0036F2C558